MLMLLQIRPFLIQRRKEPGCFLQVLLAIAKVPADNDGGLRAAHNLAGVKLKLENARWRILCRGNVRVVVMVVAVCVVMVALLGRRMRGSCVCSQYCWRLHRGVYLRGRARMSLLRPGL